MCYYIAFGDHQCLNDHPQLGPVQLYQRQCRAQAAESHRTGGWDVKCDRDTPPFWVFDAPRYPIRLRNSDLECKTCRAIWSDLDLEVLQSVGDRIREERAELKRMLERHICSPVVMTDADYFEKQKKSDFWEKTKRVLKNEIKVLDTELRRNGKRMTDRRHELAMPGEHEFLNDAFKQHHQHGNCYGGLAVLFYYGRVSRKEATKHPCDHPRHFPVPN